jgi:hypothetical protein
MKKNLTLAKTSVETRLEHEIQAKNKLVSNLAKVNAELQ